MRGRADGGPAVIHFLARSAARTRGRVVEMQCPLWSGACKRASFQVSKGLTPPN